MTMPNNIDRYELKAEIGRGSVATTYLAYDPLHNRDVALRILFQQFENIPNFHRRFKLQSSIAANITHDAIVPIYDFNVEKLYIVTRFMSGGSLVERLVSNNSLPIIEIARIITRIASALDEVHHKNVIHRDLKPSQILFDHSDQAYLTDFSLIKLFDELSVMSNNLVGTPAYMSPEQARDDMIDYRSDIYSLGVIIFVMLTGHLPYQADTPIGVVMRHIVDPVPNLHMFKPDLPTDCQIIIDKTMAKNPHDRFSTAKDIAVALASIARGEKLTDYRSDPVWLRQILKDHFDESELHDLCFDLGIDYQELPGHGKGDRARELVAYFIRRQRVSELIDAIREQRPNISW